MPAKPVPRELAELAKRHKSRGQYEANAWKLYNVGFFTDYRCNDRRGWTFPDPVFMYGPYDGSPHPFYRFPPNVTTSTGLTTNRYGWKGADIEPDKMAGSIRIAFLGASTTVNAHNFQSYSEYVENWLNMWARAKGLDVRFETINTGHETYRSMDTRALAEKELLALEPDIAVYYEGANQFRVKKDIVGVPWAYLPGPVGDVLEQLGAYRMSALLRLVRRVAPLLPANLAAADGLKEIDKPQYVINWPDGLDRNDPDIARDDLPLHLPTILADLRDIGERLRRSGAELAISSFIWMVFDGMVVDPVSGRFFFDYTNRQLWPLTYKDARALADFQNRVFGKFAAANGMPFIDVAAAFPRELSLFTDTIHMTPAGLRLRAWLTLKGLLPVISARIDSGALPRPDRAPLQSHPVTTQTVKRFPLADLECVADRDSPSGYRVVVRSSGNSLAAEMVR